MTDTPETPEPAEPGATSAFNPLLQGTLFDSTRQPDDVLREAIDQWQPTKMFGLFSGGHDSLVACHIAAGHSAFCGCIHINTGIGVEETRGFVRGVCHQYGWELAEYEPPESYESLVVAHGFPGPGHHWKMYQRLKERCLRQVSRDYCPVRGDRVLLVSGRRRHESKRRMATATAYHERDAQSSRVFVNPILDFTDDDKQTYILNHNLPRNPVVDKLCMSGECLCGAFAEPGELEQLRCLYPAAYREIKRISALVEANGEHCEWGTRPGETCDCGPCKRKRSKQGYWEGGDNEQETLPLCVSCRARHEAVDSAL